MNSRFACLLATFVVTAVVACSNTQATASPTPLQPPTAKLAPLSSVGSGEGQLDLLMRDGYADSSWAAPFTSTTGCKVKQHLIGSAADTVDLMKDGGGGQFDLVSASGDTSLTLIYGGDVRPMNATLIPGWADFQPVLKNPDFNTINGVHYGISLQWSPSTLLFNTSKFREKPTSWSVIYDSSNKGIITVPDNPIQIADGALYLSKAQPQLGIKDPYELTQKQFDAVVAQLKDQAPLVKLYWSFQTQEIDLFQRGTAMVGAAWPYQTVQLKLAGVAVDDTIPVEGATGWVDSWMLATKAPHPNCAYLWVQWVSTPRVQAMQALSVGETPVNTKACAEMEALSSGSCSQYHADAQSAYFDNIKFWKTPLSNCGEPRKICVPFDQWVSAWATIKGP